MIACTRSFPRKTDKLPQHLCAFAAQQTFAMGEISWWTRRDDQENTYNTYRGYTAVSRATLSV